VDAKKAVYHKEQKKILLAFCKVSLIFHFPRMSYTRILISISFLGVNPMTLEKLENEKLFENSFIFENTLKTIPAVTRLIFYFIYEIICIRFLIFNSDYDAVSGIKKQYGNTV
jgi:hypothetical protein